MPTALIVNYDMYLKTLPLTCKNFPKKGNYDRGIIFILPDDIIKTLYSLSSREEKENFILSERFNQSIKSYYYLTVDDDKVCICINDASIVEDSRSLNQVIQEFYNSGKEIVVNVPLDLSNFNECVECVIRCKFSDPKIQNDDLFSGKHSVCLKHSLLDHNSKKFILNEVDYLINYKNKPICGIKVRFTDDALRLLQSASHAGHSHNHDNTVSQKEMTGELKVIEFSDDHVATIGLDKTSVKLGEEEMVNVSPTRYNFHSHPKEAYIRHSVEKAWPSVVDYLGILQLGNRTIFHVVASLEGLYMISFTQHWLDKVKSIDKKFVDKNYEIDHALDYTPNEYVELVNNILHKGYPIFYVQFIPWNKATGLFSVYYGKDGMNCYFRDRKEE